MRQEDVKRNPLSYFHGSVGITDVVNFINSNARNEYLYLVLPDEVIRTSQDVNRYLCLGAKVPIAACNLTVRIKDQYLTVIGDSELDSTLEDSCSQQRKFTLFTIETLFDDRLAKIDNIDRLVHSKCLASTAERYTKWASWQPQIAYWRINSCDSSHS